MKNYYLYYLLFISFFLGTFSVYAQTSSFKPEGGEVFVEFLPIENLELTLIDQNVILDWDHPGFNSGYPLSSSFINYQIYRNTELILTTTQSWLTDLNLPFEFYNYCVYAIYSDGVSPSVCIEVNLSQVNKYNLAGTIFVNQYPNSESIAELYKIEEKGIRKIGESQASYTGYYDFYQIDEGDYLVRARLATESSLYGDFVPSYYENGVYWEQSSTIHLNSNIWDAELSLNPIEGYSSGIGSISGKVYETDISINKGMARKDVDVLLYDEEDNIIDFRRSDAEGHYLFENMSLGKYGVRIDIPGIPSPIVRIELTDIEPNINNLDFILDGKNLVSVKEIVAATSANFSPVYPNPTKGKASINYYIENPSTLHCTLYNYVGNPINSFEKKSDAGHNALEFNTSGLKAGVYFISIKLNSFPVKTMKILKI